MQVNLQEEYTNVLENQATPFSVIIQQLDALKTYEIPFKERIVCQIITAGMSLFGQLWSGKLNNETAKKKFIQFGSDYMRINIRDLEVLYTLRSSLSHNYSNYSFVRKTNAEVRFEFSTNQKKIVEKVSNGKYSVNVVRLEEVFREAIHEFFKSLEQNEDQLARFLLVCRKITALKKQ